jgi:predicted acetyltransferase
VSRDPISPGPAREGGSRIGALVACHAVAMTLRLRPLREQDEEEALAAHEELQADAFTFLLGWDPAMPWRDYVQLLSDRRRGLRLAERWVPSSFLVADSAGAIVGRASVRHRLNDFLLEEGGHIGYAVRPAHRRRGHASEILRQALIVARAEGVADVLVTCDAHNDASAAVIERLGGVLEDVRDGLDGVPKRRYWIA